MNEEEMNERIDIIGQNGNEGTHYHKLEVLYFSAPWCGPCKMFGPAFDEVVAEFTDIDVKKINIDEDLEASRKYEVMSIPTVVLEKDGVQVFRTKGVMPKTHLKDLIEMHK
jgi:thioredoxin 1